MRSVEYRVRPVTRYIVTNYYSESHENGVNSGGSSLVCELDNLDSANTVAKALAAAEPSSAKVVCTLFDE